MYNDDKNNIPGGQDGFEARPENTDRLGAEEKAPAEDLTEKVNENTESFSETAQPTEEPEIITETENEAAEEPEAEPEAANEAAEEPETEPQAEENTAAAESGEETRINPDGTYRHVYAEPWREPVYTPTGEDTGHVYSPSYYNAKTYEHTSGHINKYESQREQRERLLRQKQARKMERKKRGTGKKVMSAVAVVLVCALISTLASVITATSITRRSGSGSGGGTGNQVVLGSSGSDNGGNVQDNVSVTGSELSGADIYSLACKQVVGITTPMTTTNVFGQESSGAVTGSGFVISEDGYIMTNYHVVQYYVEGYSDELSVMFYDETEYSGKVVGYDADNDIAIVKIDATGLSPVTFGSNSGMVVGEKVYAVGNPLGELAYTMTGGMISALDREISTGDSKINMFQIDAAVNSGNSGGPVYNSKGEVVGVVTAKYSSTGVEGLGFAIPVDDAVNIATQIIENGHVSKAQLGVTVVNVSQVVTDTAIEYWGLPEGAWVYSVNSGSAADKAGLKPGDIITSVNGTAVTSTDDLKAALKAYAVGDTITLDVFRSSSADQSGVENGNELQVDVTLEEASSGASVMG